MAGHKSSPRPAKETTRHRTQHERPRPPTAKPVKKK